MLGVADVLAVGIFLDELLKRVENLLALIGAAVTGRPGNVAQPVRLAFKVNQALHVVGVVDAGIGRILADKGVGGVDRRFADLIALAVSVNQISWAWRAGSPKGKRDCSASRSCLTASEKLEFDCLLGLGIDLFRP